MKHLVLMNMVAICLALNYDANCQMYDVSVESQPFEPLASGQSLVQGPWDDPAFVAALGFTFPLFNENITELYSSDFFAGGYVVSDQNFEYTNMIIPFSSDLLDRGIEIDSNISDILTSTSGTPGSRIFTLEFRDAGFYNGEIENGIYLDYINVQLRLYESDNHIEVHIGPYSVQRPAVDFEGNPGPVIGLAEGFDFINKAIHGEMIFVTGDPLDPTVIRNIDPEYLEWPIPENTVYRFFRNTTGVVKESTVQSHYYYPNPAVNNVTLDQRFGDDILSPVRIYNSAGILVSSDKTPEIIELDALSTGLYQLQFETSKGQVTQRILRL